MTTSEKVVYEALTKLPTSKLNEFSILSFNMLTKYFTQKNYYHYCAEFVRQWDYRYPKILQIIENYACDIICLQECDPLTFAQEFGHIWQTRYNYDFLIDTKDSKKAKYKNAKDIDLIMKPGMLFNASKFDLIYYEFRSRAQIILLQQKPRKSGIHSNINRNVVSSVIENEETENKEQDSNINNSGNRKRNQKNQKQKQTKSLDVNGKYIFIVNVHLEASVLKWNIRFKQMQSILSRIQLRCKILHIILDKIPIIICGDFNCRSNEIIDHLLLDGKICKDYQEKHYSFEENIHLNMKTDVYSHSFKFCDAYQLIFDNYSHLRRPPTFSANGVTSVIDFIYFTDLNLDIYGVSQPLPAFMLQESMDDVLLLPNANWISDHLPIAGMFKFVEQVMIDEQSMVKAHMKALAMKLKPKNKRRKKKKSNKKGFHRNQKDGELVFHKMLTF